MPENLLDTACFASFTKHYSGSQKSLILLDYDGTLVPFHTDPFLALPGMEILTVLSEISRNEQNVVYIVSGRDSYTLEKWLGNLPIGLIAEHGAKTKHKNDVWINELAGGQSHWISIIETQMAFYAAKCPGAFVERKDFSVAWHYRNAEIKECNLVAEELRGELAKITNELSLDILNGNKVIEVRNKAINKATSIQEIVAQEFEFILAIGDDKTDEDILGV